MLADYLLGNGESQARTAGLPGARLIHPVKPLENSLSIPVGDADAVVGHLQSDPLPVGAGGHDNPPTVWGILDGVGEDIHNHLQNPLPVPPNIGQSFRSLQ